MMVIGSLMAGLQITLQLIPMYLMFLVYVKYERHWGWIVGGIGFALMASRRVTALLIMMGFYDNTIIGAWDRVIAPFSITLALVILSIHIKNVMSQYDRCTGILHDLVTSDYE